VSLADAVTASCAVPGVWPPATVNGRRYVDGTVRANEKRRPRRVAGAGNRAVGNVELLPSEKPLAQAVGVPRSVRGTRLAGGERGEQSLQMMSPMLLWPRDPRLRMWLPDRSDRAGRDRGGYWRVDALRRVDRCKAYVFAVVPSAVGS
jgi:NTE family protein